MEAIMLSGEASVQKIQDQALVSIEESYKLSEVRRCNVVVDRIEVPMRLRLTCRLQAECDAFSHSCF